MVFAVVQDVPATWERYRRYAEAVERPPAGLIVHAAGPTDEGYRIIELWETEDAWRRFAATVLAHAADGDEPLAARPVLRTFTTAHVVPGGDPGALVFDAQT